MSQGPRQAPHAIDLHIDELVLEGLPSLDHCALSLAVQHELAQLLAKRAIPGGLTQHSTLASLDGGDFRAAPGSTVQQIGAQIAHAVYGGLTQ